jgi:hypothetical protein
VVAATLYAVITPAWQNPDEPAHYNNIAYIARGTGCRCCAKATMTRSISRAGERRLPTHLPIGSLRYEAYQPPLYYIAATPAFWLGNGDLLACASST